MQAIAGRMGEPPPQDPAERAAYWRCLLDRLWWQDPESYWDYVLLPGLVPEQLWEHMRREADAARLAPS